MTGENLAAVFEKPAKLQYWAILNSIFYVLKYFQLDRKSNGSQDIDTQYC